MGQVGRGRHAGVLSGSGSGAAGASSGAGRSTGRGSSIGSTTIVFEGPGSVTPSGYPRASARFRRLAAAGPGGHGEVAFPAVELFFVFGPALVVCVALLAFLGISREGEAALVR
jgi:hypothetical protein